VRRESFSDPATNLLDRLDAAIAAQGAEGALLTVVPFKPAAADVDLRVCDRAWGASAAGARALDALAGATDPAAVARADGRLAARFANVRLAALGTTLEHGGEDPLATRRVACERRWTVNFGDPNTTKALHVGHLRNVALGNSLASAAEALGMQVVRQSRVGDFGRNMGEAMAGYLRHGEQLRPEHDDVKGDHLIGDCYVRYVRELAARPSDAPDANDGDAALTREREVRRDAAEELLARWRDGDPRARRLFDDVRRWVTDGHDETYARLGVRVERTLFESDYLDHGEALARRALDEGVLERVASGATMYPTGEASYPRMLMHRRDGFPTQHLRYVATYDATRPLLAGTRSIAVFGTEWRSLSRYTEAILAALYPGEELHPTDNLVHGMVVAAEGGVVKSSKGGALLVDQVFARLCEAGPLVALQRRHGRCSAEELARIVLLGFFLGRPLKQRVPIDLDELLDVRSSVGWSMAQAWARAWDPRHDGAPDPQPEDGDYRFLLVQSQRHRRLLVKCVEELDLLPFVRFHYHLTRWYAGVQTTPRLARAMRTVLGGGLDALGLVHAGAVDRSAAAGSAAEASA
jgi:arginyl-tRNA synthetase